MVCEILHHLLPVLHADDETAKKKVKTSKYDHDCLLQRRHIFMLSQAQNALEPIAAITAPKKKLSR